MQHHRLHLLCLVPAAIIALWVFAQGGSGLALAGVGLAVVVCPITMGVVMWLLMRRAPQQDAHRDLQHERTHAEVGR